MMPDGGKEEEISLVVNNVLQYITLQRPQLQRTQVPKFGNWESEENVPYTAYFDEARKGRTGPKMNPNDPQENSDTFSNDRYPVAPLSQQEAELKAQKEPEAVRSKHERRVSHEDGQLSGSTGSPLRPDAVGREVAIDLPQQHQSNVIKGPEALRTRHERRPSREEGELRRPIDSALRHDTVARKAGMSPSDTPKKAIRSVGSDRSIEHSPLHPHHQAKVGNKGSGVSSPLWERKGSSEGNHGFAPSTPGRSRLRAVTRGDETPDHGPAVPKFGDWDESDPASAEGYTHIFNRVREEKHNDGKVPVMATETYSNGQKRYRSVNSKVCECPPLHVPINH
ncbi:hypothetical protein RJ639_015350 [Escallonia herrerae]|uniref:RIN4 pathogenic type III effector avirulence factor Avr cleavage site domain-containing protein n=1 Tax=Escallonia herrerae TaxID=1293975 RepID=A0AA89AMR1_9ASTE|nr:hypothetical protein RJ639_015350 [Escallonia herrerae]